MWVFRGKGKAQEHSGEEAHLPATAPDMSHRKGFRVLKQG